MYRVSFLGHWIWDPSHKNFEASVPKGHQNINVFVGPCTDSCPDKTTLPCSDIFTENLHYEGCQKKTSN